MTLKQYDRRVKSNSGASVSNIKMTKLEMEMAKFTEVVTVKGLATPTPNTVFSARLELNKIFNTLSILQVKVLRMKLYMPYYNQIV